MDAEDYLIVTVGKIIVGINCHDVLNVYRQDLHVVPVVNQHPIYRGITRIGDSLMPVVDLRKRIGIDAGQNLQLNIVTFQTGMFRKFAVVVDSVVGMKNIKNDSFIKANTNLGNQSWNLHLLFPMVALLEKGAICHLLDPTYLDKLDPLIEESGDLELF